ncbi:MAG: hypothetical protein J6V06_08135, partial [Clostridia bacterium]|nr:hypothetical protein [Clostridia bacterium]
GAVQLQAQLLVLQGQRLILRLQPVEVPPAMYEIPDAVYEYQAGDTVEFTVKCENKGKAFETYQCDSSGPWVEASIYQKDENGNFYTLYYTHAFLADQEYVLDGGTVYLINHGDVYEETYSFVIPEDAPKGKYAISLSCYVDDDDRPENNGDYKEVFEEFITVK